MNELLQNLLPTAASALLGPVGPIATMAVKFLAGKLGVPEATQGAVIDAIASASESPEGRVRLAELDVELKKHLSDNGVRLAELSVSNAKDINETMRAEVAAEHWPSYSWRPAIGFSIAINVVLTTLTVFVAYAGVMMGKVDPKTLEFIPAMLGAMSALLIAPAGIVGVASYFRGKAQADPANAAEIRG